MMKFDVQIIHVANRYSVVLVNEDGSRDLIADIYAKEDVLLLAYFIDKAKNGAFDEVDFKDFILKNHEKFPFLEVPKE